MSDKKFKIKPKNWPKEYTFEEFKRLNPNISESLLINYYNQYLQEYAENHSRHINHFNDTKENLSKELLVLKESIGENADGDGNVGPTGAGRRFRKPLKGNTHSIQFDKTDDYILILPNKSPTGQSGITPGKGTIKPIKEMTVMTWANMWDGGSMQSGSAISGVPRMIIGTSDYNDGWGLQLNYRAPQFYMTQNEPDLATVQKVYVNIASNTMLADDRIDYRDQHPGWMHITVTFDGRYLKIYAQGLLAEGNGKNPTGNSAHTHDLGAYASGSENDIVYCRDINANAYGSGSYYGGVGIGSAIRMYNKNASSGTLGNDPYVFKQAMSLWSGSIGETAIWDKALDADAILDIYSGSMGPNERKYDLSYPGYNNGENNNISQYDMLDEGLSYENVGKYAGNLQGWWKLNEGSGTTIIDISGNGYDGVLNGGTWDSTLGTSASAAPGVPQD